MSKLFEEIPIGGMTLQNGFVRPATWEGLAHRDGSVTRKPIKMMIDVPMQKKIHDRVVKAKKAIEAMQKNTELMKVLRTIREGKGDKATVEVLCKEFDALEEKLLNL